MDQVLDWICGALGRWPELLDGQRRCHFLRWELVGLEQKDQGFLLNFQVQKLNLSR